MFIAATNHCIVKKNVFIDFQASHGVGSLPRHIDDEHDGNRFSVDAVEIRRRNKNAAREGEKRKEKDKSDCGSVSLSLWCVIMFNQMHAPK